MFKGLILLVSLICSLPALHAQFEGTFGVGLHTGYASAVERPGAGIHLHYYRTNNLRFAPGFTRYLEANGMRIWMVEGDLHYILPLNYAASLYPLAGIHYTNWHHHREAALFPTEEEYTRHRLGSSLGIGYQYDIGYRVRANLELKYQFIRDYSQVLFTAGFGFWF